ncbi:MAG: hypothetical protein H7A25_26030 [Leptospiraceae bacterium]|nr:hypothetical protein [Leptospiraceae bacterium]
MQKKQSLSIIAFSMSMFRGLTVVLLFLSSSLYALDREQLRIHSILLDNISINTFHIYINAPENIARSLLLDNIQKKSELKIKQENEEDTETLEPYYLSFMAIKDGKEFKARIIPGSFVSEDSTLSMVQIQFFDELKEGEYELKMYLNYYGKVQGESLDTKTFRIETRREKAGEQPFISEVAPAAGVAGDTIIIRGNNLARVSADSIEVQFIRKGKKKILNKNDILSSERPFYTSRGSKGIDEIRFSIPELLEEELGLMSIPEHGFRSFLGHPIQLRLMVANRPSKIVEIRYLSKRWKLIAGSVSISAVILFLLMISYIMKKFNFLKEILLESETNTYSLTKFQAFLWTLVLIGSYLYVAICWAMILGNGVIPDFNASLIALMGVSYGGMISSKIIENKKPKNEIRETSPSLKNLFCTGNEVDMARLQLFGFTIVSIIAFLFTMVQSNILNGLPDIPPTLHGLLTASQAGYLSGKMVSDDISVSVIKPTSFKVSEKNLLIHLVGTGFKKEMQVLVGDLGPFPVEFKNPSSCSFQIPGFEAPGKYDLILIPSEGKKTALKEAIQIQGEDEK